MKETKYTNWSDITELVTITYKDQYNFPLAELMSEVADNCNDYDTAD